MKWVYRLLLGFGVLVLAACSGTSDNEHKEPNETKEENVTEAVAASLQKNGSTVTYTLSNHTDKDITLPFSSSQRYDYAIEKDGETLFTLGSVSTYVREEGEERLMGTEPLSYTFDIREADLESGVYHLRVWMTTSDGPKYENGMNFEIE
ncbi:hypothetical protein IMZ31_19395 (plasmid) [Pontibacillus sp. ALD_SL1]|uniref:BsuPI-related putative proteinase inhibitor n=1 Tax=Pontibacillus sp. ALD_SL1 TaxID=2777185 RepID=UPI001A959F49|nr:BsuPI-related putative proteinase inhibitor [Pontibacillus sp. ALD_SL1]QST02716.1 hypothetical protein IMZ31_19395 [Pontibacillus sp. ALD_SL1]